MKYIVLTLFLCVATTLSVRTEDEYRSAFKAWMEAHSRSYSHDIFLSKYNTFKNNVDIIDTNNAQNNGLTLSLNQFADLSNAEFITLYTGSIAQATNTGNVQVINSTFPLPTAFDWRVKGAVTPPSDQGNCASSYAFSATGALEGLMYLSYGKLMSLSAQQLMECATAYGNQGCVRGSNKGFTQVQANSRLALETAICLQPVSAAVGATASAWQFYSSGVITAAQCGTAQLNQAVLVVGYGSVDGQDVYIVKNSWGTSWGVQGYVYLERGADGPGACGIQTQASYPI